ncbi:DUF1830 domain-containing protein [Lyngbya confervoides BDU141951]|uniref:DUF1830 domain-containing protein n=2 Tax=Lyngbya TaxID=28073 RepID=A0ABD4T751_9CYAN|nr:DUF1830 domain-containing protein [Lyngbya confervoides]MCM1984412.1 DUF1830 domain-containing protein [Lyngbya confervoides BDU141951]
MFQILDALPDNYRRCAVLSYVNSTRTVQIARIKNIPNWSFERVVFPGQRLIFEAPLEARLQIHTGGMASAILTDTIPCRRLALDRSAALAQAHDEQQAREHHHEGFFPDPDRQGPNLAQVEDRCGKS